MIRPSPRLAWPRSTRSSRGRATAGLPTTVRQDGAPWPLPAGVDLAAYRIIQESLTNAIRHAGPARATISLCYGDSALRIEVADTGRGLGPAAQSRVQSDGAGHGLVGMQERAAAVGGTLRAGPEPGAATGWWRCCRLTGRRRRGLRQSQGEPERGRVRDPGPLGG